MYTDEEYEKWKKAGNIAAKALHHGASLTKAGVSLLSVTEEIEKKVLELGGKFAFPPQISLNKIAAHYCADLDDKIIFAEGDMIKIDVGVHIDGFIGDNALTVDLGENQKLVDASRNALDKAISIIKPETTLGEVGAAIQKTIQDMGYSPVRNLSGHGLGKYEFHAHPSVPNVATNDKTRLKKGQVIAIEPFATNGQGMIYETNSGNIFSQVSDKPVRNLITRNVYSEIKKYKYLPFTTRWLTKKFHAVKVNFALKELLNAGIIRMYPPLPDREGIVSQAEHTIIVDDPCIITTKF